MGVAHSGGYVLLVVPSVPCPSVDFFGARRLKNESAFPIITLQLGNFRAANLTTAVQPKYIFLRRFFNFLYMNNRSMSCVGKKVLNVLRQSGVIHLDTKDVQVFQCCYSEFRAIALFRQLSLLSHQYPFTYQKRRKGAP